METLRVLDVDSLDVAVELLLSTLLVVSSAGNADAQSVGNTLDTLLPDLLVQLGVDADISSTLNNSSLALTFHACCVPSFNHVLVDGPSSLP